MRRKWRRPCARRPPGVPDHVVSCRLPESLDVLRRSLGHGPNRRAARIVRSRQVHDRQPADRTRSAAGPTTCVSRTAAAATPAPPVSWCWLPGCGVLIDTPGMRELQLWDTGDGTSGSFDDVDALAASCRYRDCRHLQEPGCAVRAAVDAGTLTPGRFESYHKLQAEQAHQSRQLDQRAQESTTSGARKRARRPCRSG